MGKKYDKSELGPRMLGDEEATKMAPKGPTRLVELFRKDPAPPKPGGEKAEARKRGSLGELFVALAAIAAVGSIFYYAGRDASRPSEPAQQPEPVQAAPAASAEPGPPPASVTRAEAHIDKYKVVGNESCQKIASSCWSAGFDKFASRPGRKLGEDCVQPIMGGRTVASVTVDHRDVVSCRQSRMQLIKKKKAAESDSGKAGG